MPPSTTRDQYVVGRLGSYMCPTVAAVDGHLRVLRGRLRLNRPIPGPIDAGINARLRDDIDRLLDRRRELEG